MQIKQTNNASFLASIKDEPSGKAILICHEQAKLRINLTVPTKISQP